MRLFYMRRREIVLFDALWDKINGKITFSTLFGKNKRKNHMFDTFLDEMLGKPILDAFWDKSGQTHFRRLSGNTATLDSFSPCARHSFFMRSPWFPLYAHPGKAYIKTSR